MLTKYERKQCRHSSDPKFVLIHQKVPHLEGPLIQLLMLFPAGLLILMAIKFGWSHKSICPIRIQSRMQMYTFRVEMVNFTGGLSFSTRRLTKEIQST